MGRSKRRARRRDWLDGIVATVIVVVCWNSSTTWDQAKTNAKIMEILDRQDKRMTLLETQRDKDYASLQTQISRKK